MPRISAVLCLLLLGLPGHAAEAPADVAAESDQARSDYAAAAERAMAARRWQRAERLLHFALALDGVTPERRTRLRGRLELARRMAARSAGDDELDETLATERRRLQRLLLGGDIDQADVQAFARLVALRPADPLLDRLRAALRPEWAIASGQDAHGAWVGLRAGWTLLRFRLVPVGRLVLDDGSVLVNQRNVWITETPVTVEQWEGLFPGRDDAPVRGDLPWTGRSASALAAAVERWDRSRPDLHLRLPTPSEWAFACRAGCPQPFLPDVDGSEDLIAARLAPAPVGRHARNAWGLWDVHGGVWELCRDQSGTLFRRGGSWRSDLADCAFPRQVPVLHDAPDPTLGLRLVIDR